MSFEESVEQWDRGEILLHEFTTRIADELLSMRQRQAAAGKAIESLLHLYEINKQYASEGFDGLIKIAGELEDGINGIRSDLAAISAAKAPAHTFPPEGL